MRSKHPIGSTQMYVFFHYLLEIERGRFLAIDDDIEEFFLNEERVKTSKCVSFRLPFTL